MTTRSPVVAFTLGLGLVLSLGACSSDDKDGPPATETPPSIAEDVAAPTDTPTADTTGNRRRPTTVPSTGIGSIDGPATVDPDFGGANPGGDDGGG